MPGRFVGGLLTAAALGVDGARISRKGSSAVTPKQLAGVPLVNYELAYGGKKDQSNEKEHWVVVAKRGVSTAKLEELCKSTKECERFGHPSEGGFPFFEVHSTEEELEQVLALAPGQIEFVEPDGTYSLDPEQSSDAESAEARSLWGLGRVGASDKFASGAGAHIYILDTGIRVTHRDFGGRASGAIDLASDNLIECQQGSISCANDLQGHGTHCAGTAGGGRYGVATSANIYAVKVLGDRGSGQMSWSYQALDWLSTKGFSPTIASMSLGGRGTQDAMKNAVDAATDAGVMVVVAAGNSNSNACQFSPAFIPSALTIGSTDAADLRSSFSNHGRCVGMWAPGSDILSAGHRSDTASATKSGTSMACPHVSGAAALVRGQDSSKTPSEVLEELTRRAEKDALGDLRPGDVNIFLWVGSSPSPVPAPTPEPPFRECPLFAAQRRPDQDGNCMCPTGQVCSTSGWWDPDCPTSEGEGGFNGRKFQVDCSFCKCYRAF